MLKEILNYLKKIGLMILGFFGIFLTQKSKENKGKDEEEDEGSEEKIFKRTKITFKTENTPNTFQSPKPFIQKKENELYELENLGMIIIKENEFVVYKVYKGSLAEKNGFKEGDIIKKINDQKTKDMEIADLKKELEKDEIKFETHHNGEKSDITITQTKQIPSPKKSQPPHPDQDSKETAPKAQKENIKTLQTTPIAQILTPPVINLNIKEPIFTKT